ncbi:tetratricopeptide repeat protein [Nonlabens sp.]|uniref:tetratricopeptide repeat protein n=1 Tax=Nonlabens sp. TaxID=1888209 RepID=UPI003F69E9FB
MKVNSALLCILAVLLFSCNTNQNEFEAEEISVKAFEVYMDFSLDNDVRLDSALLLFDKALELDDQNFTALNNKIGIYAEKKDIKGLLDTNARLIEMFPERPLYKIQRGLFLLINKEIIKGEAILDQALIEYESQLKSDISNFDFNIEYIWALSANEKYDAAQAHLNLMKKHTYQDFQHYILDNFEIQERHMIPMLDALKVKDDITVDFK